MIFTGFFDFQNVEFYFKINFLFPSLKGGKFLENSSKLHPLGFGE